MRTLFSVRTDGNLCLRCYFPSLLKKALDYVSDYQLKSACKDAICIAPSKVTQMIFAVLEDCYRHVVLTHNFELVSFFTHIFP